MCYVCNGAKIHYCVSSLSICWVRNCCTNVSRRNLCYVWEDYFLWSYITALLSSSLQPCWIALSWNGSTLLSDDIVGILVPYALGDSEGEGSMGRLVSSTCLIYCPARLKRDRRNSPPSASLWSLLPDYSPGEAHHHQPQDIGSNLSPIAPGHSIEPGHFPAHGSPACAWWLIYVSTPQTAWLAAGRSAHI